MKLSSTLAAAAVALTVAAGGAALAGPKVKLEPVVSGLNSPLAMIQPPGDDRTFVIEQWGRVLIIEDGQIAGTFLDIRDQVADLHPFFDERGLLGLAFHPDFKTNGKFFVSYSAALDAKGDLGVQVFFSHSNVVSEFRVSSDDPNQADQSSERILMSTPWPQFNHNGHWIGFGPDGMLYVTMGDGGYANDWEIGHNVIDGNGQDLATPNGKILRIDPASGEAAAGNPFIDNEDADPRIWAYGMRNPWRCSFDMGGDHMLICGELGQNSYEEIDIIEKGANYGWRRMEATHCFDFAQPDNHPAACDQDGLTLPVMWYKNCAAKPDGCQGISVIGGYVYRGAHDAWDGAYVFGDWSRQFMEPNGQIMIGTPNGDGTWTHEVAEIANFEGNLPYVLAFGQDHGGEVYALTSVTTGPVGSQDTIYKIVPAE